MLIPFIQKLVDLLENIKRPFAVCITEGTFGRWADYPKMEELGVTCMHTANHLTAASAIIQTAIEHRNQMNISIEILVITVVTATSGQ